LKIGWPVAILYIACIKSSISLCKVKGRIEQQIAALEKPTGKYLVCTVNSPKISYFFGINKDHELVLRGI
jgi:hypothetical protein